MRVTQYKVYRLDGAGKIAQVPEYIDASSDEEAVALLQAQKRPLHCEIWDRNRLVRRVPGHRT
jgi:hypothetical protein